MGTERGTGSAIAAQMASRVCETITTLHHQNPSLLTDPIRQNWPNPAYQGKVSQKLTAVLIDTPTQQHVQKRQQIFSQIFTPAFLNTPEHRSLDQAFEEILNPTDPVEKPAAGVESGAIAILLLDAENLQLSAQQEAYLSILCSYPLQVKIAFANWKKLGKYDEEFHQRDYDLIHVPSGNDMADGKMIAIGSSLKDHYRTVQEVLVCSSDKVMTSLCTKLRQQGLTVYKIRKQNNGTLSILNSATGTTSEYPEETLPDLEQCIQRLQAIIWNEQQAQSRPWIKLSTISKRFHSETGFQLTKIVNTYMPGKRARDLFIENPELFGIHKPSDEAELYISLFSPIEANQTKEKGTDSPQIEDKQPSGVKTNPSDSQAVKTSAKLPFKNGEQLEAAIAAIIKTMDTEDPSGFVTIARVGGLFRQRYQIPITQAIKQLNIGKKYPHFLQSCQSLIVQKQDNDWGVKLRS